MGEVAGLAGVGEKERSKEDPRPGPQLQEDGAALDQAVWDEPA